MKFSTASAERFSALVTLMMLGITALSIPVVNAAPGDVNSINDGRDIQSGTYFNTPGSRTTFQNSSGGGLWLHSGDLARGLESDINKTPTGNGGTLYFRAPGNVVRLDGTIDVSAVRNGSLYTGNGGKVFIDSGYLFQSGNIFANGVNGGLVQLNVGGLTMGSNAKITAQGFGGNGGAISINSTGTVDLQTSAILDTSGKVMGTIDTNIINVEGSAINNQGIIRANGMSGTDLKPDDGDAAVMTANPQLANNPVPGPITEGSGTGNTAVMQNILFATPPSADFRGGTVRLIAAGQTNSTTDIVNNADSQMLTSTEKSNLNNRNSQIVSFNEGDVFNRGNIQADGTLSKNGGTIIIGAARNIINSTTIHANGADGVNGFFDANGNGVGGGNGGTIVFTALGRISNNGGTIQANGGRAAGARSLSISTGNGQDANATITNLGGTGGQGGVIAFNSDTSTPMTNSGTIQANGGIGGLGGHANTFDQEGATGSNPNPVARATSNAGQGGAGGHGGLILFSGNGNPTGGGSVQVNGGQGGRGGNAWADAQAFTSGSGTPSAVANVAAGAGGIGGAAGAIISPDPATLTSQSISSKAGGSGDTGIASFRQVVTKNGISSSSTGSTPSTPGSVVTGNNQAVIATRKNEYIRHEDAAILLSENGGDGTTNTNLTGRLSDALIRTVSNPNGVVGDTLADAESSSSLIIGSTATADLTNDLVNANTDPKFFNLNTLTITNNGNINNNMLWTPGVHLIGAGFHDMEFGLGGGHISWLANGNIINNQIVITRGLWSGGSTHVAATQDIINNNDFINIGPNKALISGFTIAGPLYESSHSGSLTFKAGRDITNASTGKIETNQIFFDIHPPLNQNPPIDWPLFLNGAQIGSTVNLLAGRNLSNAGIINAMALTYRNGQLGADNPALTMGGILIGRAKTGTISNTGTMAADGAAFFSPNETDGPRFNTNTFPPTTSFNGTVDVH
jgi:hypothetical protein